MDNNELKILLVDDETDILEFISYNLKKEGYQVKTSTNGEEAIRIAKEYQPHLILLDVMMPKVDGIETCNEIRQIENLSETVIAFLTARSEDYSQIAGFEAGADDYISKPIRPKVLLSRVKALLRRFVVQDEIKSSKDKILKISNITIDSEKYMVFKDGKEITLPKKEFELLALLASKPNKVFRREEIFSNIWGNNVIVGDRTIDVHVRKIREKMGIENIRTIKGVGYKFEE